ncbi:MAG: phosphate-starvation-inducible PsiE family protein [Terrisporobacter sp.]|uniref:phosphate-starvation-inducible PsiE family protein n=1 Tax=Terrisporobacter sp. TaxID=1965305 RepID=UPI0039926760
MVEKESRLLLKVSKAFETALSIVLIIIIFLGMIDLVRSVYAAYIVDFANPVEYSQLNAFLAEALLLVIGVELVVMLSLHIPGALLEVLLYAIARKLILLPKTSGMGDLLLGIIAIGCIFAIKKYLMTDSERKTTMHRVYNWIKDKSLDNHKNDAVS